MTTKGVVGSAVALAVLAVIGAWLVLVELVRLLMPVLIWMDK